jgi:hypothetical protein
LLKPPGTAPQPVYSPFSILWFMTCLGLTVAAVFHVALLFWARSPSHHGAW